MNTDDIKAEHEDDAQDIQEIHQNLIQQSASIFYRLNLLMTIKMAQNQNGIRHNDFQRYSRYCSRRIHRIRKALKLGQGKKQFHKKAVTIETATSTKMLMIIVFTCERDWALAQHLKNEMNEEKNEQNTRIKFALAKKLQKAVKNSLILIQIVRAKLDSRSLVEVEAYAAFMLGLYLLEVKKAFKEALSELLKAKLLYQKLGETPDALEAIMFEERVKQIEPGIRLCSFNLEGLQTSKLLSQAVTYDQIKDGEEVKALVLRLEEDKTRKKTKNLDQVELNGVKVPLQTPKLKNAFHRVDDLKTQLFKESAEMSQENKNKLFTELFGAIDEALDVFKKEKAEEQKKSDYSAVLFNEVINFFNLTRCETQLEKIRFHLDSTYFQGKFEPAQLLEMVLKPQKHENQKQKEIVRGYQKLIRALKALLQQLEQNKQQGGVDFALRMEFDFFEQLYNIYVSTHAALCFGSEQKKDYKAAIAMLSHSVKKDIVGLIQFQEQHNLAKNPHVKPAYDTLVEMMKVIKKIECVYHGRLLRQKEHQGEQKIITDLELNKLVEKNKRKAKRGRAKSVPASREEEKKAPRRGKSQEETKKKDETVAKQREHYYLSLYDLIQEAQKLQKGDKAADWTHRSKLKPTPSELHLFRNVTFNLEKDLGLAKEYLQLASQEQQVGIDHRLQVEAFRGKAREFIIKQNVEKLKLSSKSRLIDLQVSLKSIPAKSAINDIAGEFLPMPDISHRMKEKKTGITAFLKSKLWG